jgi:transmembrane sensor
VKPKAINAQIYTEASDWLVEFRSGDVGTEGRKDFHQWLKTSPEHMRAYLELAAIWNEGSGLDRDRTFDDARLERDMLLETNVAEFPRARTSELKGRGLSSGESDRPRSATRRIGQFSTHRIRRGRFAAFAASGLLAILSIGFWYIQLRNTYVTSVGEERTVSLTDGSTIELNSNSVVRLNFSQAMRGVELLRGQALFHVAKDHTRPFIVRTNNVQVRAVGTQFDVYRNQAATTVTVVEGTVAVLPAGSGSSGVIGKGSDNVLPASPPTLAISSGPGEMLVTAGEQVTVTPAAAPKPIKADVATATSWAQHQLIFKGASLENVAEEFNRYNKRHLIIHDSLISNLKITGIFSSTDPSSLIRFLEARPDIAVTVSGNEIVVSRKP